MQPQSSSIAARGRIVYEHEEARSEGYDGVDVLIKGVKDDF